MNKHENVGGWNSSLTLVIYTFTCFYIKFKNM